MSPVATKPRLAMGIRKQKPETPLGRLFRESGRSLRELAREMGMDPRQLQLILRGETDARMSTVGRVLNALGKTCKATRRTTSR
jgi:hypothetical protein